MSAAEPRTLALDGSDSRLRMPGCSRISSGVLQRRPPGVDTGRERFTCLIGSAQGRSRQ
jgi:hypothetical protein